jgi:prepilin-type N-terminal cleavage/methylation domain-containing protein
MLFPLARCSGFARAAATAAASDQLMPLQSPQTNVHLRSRAGMRVRLGFTLIELLCVIVVIAILVGLVLRPASRVLHRARADQWENRSSVQVQAVVDQLKKHFQGKNDFPLVTLERIETEQLLRPAQIAFLKDSRVEFLPFASSDADEKIVIRVALERGYLSEPGYLTENKGHITALPE